MYKLEYDQDWDNYLQVLPAEIQIRFLKRREKYAIFPTTSFRHEKHGICYFVDEIGQYRLLFTSDENLKIRTFYFIGKYKHYDKFMGTRK